MGGAVRSAALRPISVMQLLVGAASLVSPGVVGVAASSTSPWSFCSSGNVVLAVALTPELLCGRVDLYRGPLAAAVPVGGVGGTQKVRALDQVGWKEAGRSSGPPRWCCNFGGGSGSGGVRSFIPADEPQRLGSRCLWWGIPEAHPSVLPTHPAVAGGNDAFFTPRCAPTATAPSRPVKPSRATSRPG